MPGRCKLCSHQSLPVRERGLKQLYANGDQFRYSVAPRAGAWIEAPSLIVSSQALYVAPRAGAWIEAQADVMEAFLKTVSLPVRERGLKHVIPRGSRMLKRRSPCGSVD